MTEKELSSKKRRNLFIAGGVIFLLLLLLSTGFGVQASGFQIYLPVIYSNRAPTATNTPQPSPTQTNTPIPTNTQIPPSPGVFVLPNHTYFVDSFDYLHVVGEVQNNTDNYLTWVKVTVNFYNASNQLIDNDFTYLHLESLPPGDKTCFETFTDYPTDFSYYSFEAPTNYTDGAPLPNLTILNDSGKYNSTYNWYEIIGEVRNDHGSRVEYVTPLATLYNSSGSAIGCDWTYVNSTNLDPDQTSSFKIIASDRDYNDVASYRLQVDGSLP